MNKLDFTYTNIHRSSKFNNTQTLKSTTTMKACLPIVFMSLCILFSSQSATAQFITTWKTDNAGTSSDTQITIPTTGSGYDYTIYWEEVGNPTNNATIASLTNSHTIEFGSIGTFQVEISGTFPRIYFNNDGDRLKILTVEQWGNIAWTSMETAFYGCENLTIPAVDAPDLSGVTNMSGMFREALSFNQDISNWNVSNVADMSIMFLRAISFNQNINSWDVSSVTDMSSMFNRATAFNQDLNGWDVSNVTDMNGMFFNGFHAIASTFNGNISAWDVSSVTNMNKMFSDADVFNQNIGGWNVSNVTDMGEMFARAPNFNQNLNNWDVSNVTNMEVMFGNRFSGTPSNFNGDISSWDVSNVTNMSFMFNRATSFNQDISSWNISSATDIEGMFSVASSFNQDISSWDVSKVTDMRELFNTASSFNQDISNWNTGNVTMMSTMFSGAASFNADISGWDVSQVTTMNRMFGNATNFNQDISGWNVSNVTDTRVMFYQASNFDQDLSNWDITSVTQMDDMLTNSGLSQVNYDLLLQGWATQSVQSGVTFGVTGLIYCAGTDARQQLIDDHSWVFSGDTPDCTQSITFDPLADRATSDLTFDLTATASSGLPVSYTSSNTGVATVSGSTVTLVGIGTTTITASQPGDAIYPAATPVDQVLTVTIGDQNIVFDPIDDKTLVDDSFMLTATGGASGNPLTYESSDLTVATVSGSTVTIVGLGTTTITANQAGNTNFNAASPVDQTLTVTKEGQVIIFDSLPDKTIADNPFAINATGGASGNPVTFTSSNLGVATISGNAVTIVGLGTTTITANQVGNDTYSEAIPVQQTLTVTKIDQTITFEFLMTKEFEDPAFDLSATASSGLPVSYASSNTDVATVSGSILTIVGAGTTTITASQVGNADYNEATSIERNLTIIKSDQAITFDVLSGKRIGDPEFDLSAISSSGLTVSYTSSNTNVATVSGSTVTIVGPGTTTITANQSGNNNYNMATPVEQALQVEGALSVNLSSEISIYPNPVLDYLNIEWDNFKQATLYDFSGRKISTYSQRIIRVNSLPKGTYLLKLEGPSGQAASYRIVKD